MKKNVSIQITDKPIIRESVISQLEAKDCGAVVSFTGRVRGTAGDIKVYALEHDANTETAKDIFNSIVREIEEKWDIKEIAFCYRTGPVDAGEITLVITVATTRRPEAFAACQFAIDRFKQLVSAKEIREDGEFWISAKT